MWNIVRMDDGKNYLVDVTNCDAGKVGAPELLFLKGWKSGSLSAGYQYRGESSVGAGYYLTYQYDSYTRLAYTEAELTLSGTDYNYHAHVPSAPVSENRIEPSYENEGSYEAVVYCEICGKEMSRTLTAIEPLEPLETPVLTEIKNEETAVLLRWEPVPGAKAYRVLRREAGESWAAAMTVGETTGTSLADGAAAHGTAYVYSVFCYDPELEEAASGYDGAGLSITRHIMPENLQNAAAPTCTEAGYSGDYICTECGETVSGHVIEALGHEEEIRNDRPASYTEGGYTGDVVCARCGALLREGSVLPKLEAIVFAAQSLTEGGSLKLSAPELNGRTVSWAFTEAESMQYASLSGNGKLTAKAVTERHTVAVLARASDDSVKVLFPVEIVPAVKNLLLLDEAGEAVTGQTVVFDLNGGNHTELRFHAAVQPEAASPSVIWTVSDSRRTVADYSAENGVLTVSGIRAAGTVTIMAKADDGSGKTAKVTLKTVRYPTSVRIESPALPSPEGEYLMRGGQSLSLKTNVATEPGLTDRTVFWSVSDDSIPYAGISGTGRLTTKAVYEPVSIHVTARVRSGVEDELCIRLIPAAAAVQIRHDGTLLSKGQKVLLPEGETLSLNGSTLPAGAMPGGSWKSSNAKVAAVGTDGTVTGLRTGTATVTYTAADGSGKNTNIKIQVGSRSDLAEVTSASGSLNAGKSLTLTAWNASGSAIAPKNLKWESSNPAAATVSSTGKVTAKTVSAEESVTIRVFSPFEPANVREVNIRVCPAKDSLSLWREEENLTGKTIAVDAEQAQLDLTAKLYQVLTGDTAETDVTWTSSSAQIAAVENGVVRFTGKTGSVNVTAKSGKLSAKVGFKVIRSVKAITLSEKNGGETVLISGKSLQLKAELSPADATTKGLVWSCSDPTVASVSSSGKLTAKPVYSVSAVTVTAEAKDGSGVTGSCTVIVYPAAACVMIEQVNDDFTARVMNGRTVAAAAGDQLVLRAVIYPAEAWQEAGVTWSSSNGNLARVDADGIVTARAKGSVKITAKANDGSGKSAFFTLKID